MQNRINLKDNVSENFNKKGDMITMGNNKTSINNVDQKEVATNANKCVFSNSVMQSSLLGKPCTPEERSYILGLFPHSGGKYYTPEEKSYITRVLGEDWCDPLALDEDPNAIIEYYASLEPANDDKDHN